MRIQALLFIFTFCAPSLLAQPLSRVRVEAPPWVAADLAARGFDVLPGTIGEAGFELIGSSRDLAAVEAMGWSWELIAEGRPFAQIQAERLAADPVRNPVGYPTLDEVIAQMAATVAAFPDICRFVDLTGELGMPPTHEGRHLYAAVVSDNVQVEEDEPAYLLVANHHARELVTPVIALHALDQLTALYGSDPRITAAVDDHEIWIIPVFNPDGYEYVFNVDNWWRKNRRNNGGGAFGVDLNRNYPFGWGQCGGSQDRWSEVYEGPSAASEQETQTMIALGLDRRFAKVADMHSYAREIRHGYGCWSHPWDPFLIDEAVDLSLASGYGGAVGSSCCLGGDIHFHMTTYGAHAFLWETATEFQPPYTSAQAEAAMVWPAILFQMERPIPLRGKVTDARTGDPVAADVEFVGVPFQHGEAHNSGGDFGNYYAFPPPGTYQVRFAADGYTPQAHEVMVSGDSTTFLDVALVGDCPPDFNGDGDVDSQDFIAFLNAFVAADPAADFNGDGTIDSQDFIAFLNAFVAGC